jgi:hypothetical protein
MSPAARLRRSITTTGAPFLSALHARNRCMANRGSGAWMIENVIGHLIPFGGSLLLGACAVVFLRSGEVPLNRGDTIRATRGRNPVIYWGVVLLFAMLAGLLLFDAVAMPWSNSN